jgi:hypothetical protein
MDGHLHSRWFAKTDEVTIPKIIVEIESNIIKTFPVPFVGSLLSVHSQIEI